MRRRSKTGWNVNTTDAIVRLTRDCFQLIRLISVNKTNTSEACDLPAESTSNLQSAVPLHLMQCISFQLTSL
jgi:hypothetical protein